MYCLICVVRSWVTVDRSKKDMIEFFHALHGSSRARNADDIAATLSSLSTSSAGHGSLLASCGRLVCVAMNTHVDVYDAHDVSEMSAVLGAGACKMRFICSFPVTDISDPVRVSSIAFLRGGLLATAGSCIRGTGEWIINQSINEKAT